MSSETIAEARQLAHGLAPRCLLGIGLTAALDAMIDRVGSVTTIKFKRHLESVTERISLQLGVTAEFFRIRIP